MEQGKGVHSCSDPSNSPSLPHVSVAELAAYPDLHVAVQVFPDRAPLQEEVSTPTPVGTVVQTRLVHVGGVPTNVPSERQLYCTAAPV